MKKLIMLTFVIALMAACANDNEAEKQTPNEEQVVSDVEEVDVENEEQATEGKESGETATNTNSNAGSNTNESSESKSEASSFQSAIPSGWDVTLPSDFPVTNGKHLTAITNTQQDEVTFEFYEADKEIPLNDPSIKKAGQLKGHLTITKYASEEAASKEIDQTVFKQGEKVDLGHGITGYQDAGAGSLFTSWNEGRWAIMARSTTEKAEVNVATAKETVEFLEKNTMPIPKQYGELHIDAEHSGSLAKWQKQNLAYSLTDFGDQTLEWLVSFK